MAKSDNKTRANNESVDEFLGKVEDDERRADANALREMMQRLSGKPAVMWGSSIIGFGSYRYRYDSGREGTMVRVGFSPRAKELVLYVMGDVPRLEELLRRLGKYRTGKSCVYIKRLSDVDRTALESLISESLRYSHQRYPQDA